MSPLPSTSGNARKVLPPSVAPARLSTLSPLAVWKLSILIMLSVGSGVSVVTDTAGWLAGLGETRTVRMDERDATAGGTRMTVVL